MHQITAPSSSDSDARAPCWASPGCRECHTGHRERRKASRPSPCPGGILPELPQLVLQPRAQIWASPPLSSISLPFSLTLPPTGLHPSPRTPLFGLTLCGSICLGCEVVIKEVLKEIWKENEGGFMMWGGEFCYAWEQCRTKRRADLIYRKSLLE